MKMIIASSGFRTSHGNLPLLVPPRLDAWPPCPLGALRYSDNRMSLFSKLQSSIFVTCDSCLVALGATHLQPMILAELLL